MDYDSRVDTWQHIHEVQKRLQHCINLLHIRSLFHDQSKLEAPEVEYFDKFTGKLKDLTYGTDEYFECIKELKPALDHHYKKNSHHPEYHRNGIQDMSLIDVMEMLCDWMAATLRSANGDIYRSIDLNQDRFKYSDDLTQILKNTAKILYKE
jgi:hypothetical protein